MSNLNGNKSGLFLMELIVVTLFFSVAAVICLKVFYAGESLSKESQVLTNTVIQAQNAAQLIKSDNGGIETFCDYYGATAKDGIIILYFDDEFAPCDGNMNASIKMVVKQKIDGEIIDSTIDFIDIAKDESLYCLETKTYTGRNSR
ncbi:MAG: type II secretion system protein [Anaerotignaceae bacterium]